MGGLFIALIGQNLPVESPVTLRAKAAHCMKLAELMGQETRARLIQKANDYLEHAVKLEEEARKK